MSRIAVVGGGAAGMMAAIRAAERGHSVTIYEKNEKLGKKVYITGKGRCNVTNACDAEEFFEHISGNAKFFYSAFYGFNNLQVMSLLENAGCPLKIERGNRVFPVSDHSSDVIKALRQLVESLGCEICYHTPVKALIAEPYSVMDEELDKKNKYEQRILGVVTSDGRKVFYDNVILATGGVSIPLQVLPETDMGLCEN